MINTQPYVSEPTQLLFRHVQHDLKTQRRVVHIVRRSDNKLQGVISFDTRNRIYKPEYAVDALFTDTERMEIEEHLELLRQLMRVGGMGQHLATE